MSELMLLIEHRMKGLRANLAVYEVGERLGDYQDTIQAEKCRAGINELERVLEWVEWL